MSSRTDRVTEFARWEYEAKVDWLKAHFDRLLRRFNLFLTLATALASGLVFALQREVEGAALGLAVVGGIMSFMWLLSALADRRLVLDYRLQVEKARGFLLEVMEGRAERRPEDLPHVGARRTRDIDYARETWFSVTALPAWIAGLAMFGFFAFSLWLILPG